MTPKGWCPGALRPMPAGDGLLLRLRPRASQLSSAQVAGVARLAQAFGNGAVDLGSRASLQLRGIAPERLPPLQDELAGLGLIDADPAQEAKRNILTSPLWQAGDQTLALHDSLADALSQSPDMPAKFGFSIDTGSAACLQDASADLRLELSEHGLILRADGMTKGEPLTKDQLAEKLLQLLHWFARTGCKRMRDAVSQGNMPPLAPLAQPRGQDRRIARLAGRPLLFAPYGASSAAAFAELQGAGLRLTPWRAVLPDAAPAAPRFWLTDPEDRRLRVDACPGIAGCASASVETRPLATRLAARLHPGQSLHVSGCAKGCARPGRADLTLVGREGRFDLILRGRPGDPPLRRGLSPDELPNSLGGLLAPPL